MRRIYSFILIPRGMFDLLIDISESHGIINIVSLVLLALTCISLQNWVVDKLVASFNAGVGH